jgi:hypothetical protein
LFLPIRIPFFYTIAVSFFFCLSASFPSGHFRRPVEHHIFLITRRMRSGDRSGHLCDRHDKSIHRRNCHSGTSLRADSMWHALSRRKYICNRVLCRPDHL